MHVSTVRRCVVHFSRVNDSTSPLLMQVLHISITGKKALLMVVTVENHCSVAENLLSCVILFFVVVIVSIKINMRHYFRSDLRMFFFFPKDTTPHCHNHSSVMQNTRSCPKCMSVFSVPSPSLMSGEGLELSASAISLF